MHKEACVVSFCFVQDGITGTHWRSNSCDAASLLSNILDPVCSSQLALYHSTLYQTFCQRVRFCSSSIYHFLHHTVVQLIASSDNTWQEGRCTSGWAVAVQIFYFFFMKLIFSLLLSIISVLGHIPLLLLTHFTLLKPV